MKHSNGGVKNFMNTLYANYSNGTSKSKALKRALKGIDRSLNISKSAIRHKIPRITLQNSWSEYQKCDDLDTYLKGRNKRLVLLTEDEEIAVERYCLWQSDRGMPETNKNIKAPIRELHSKAIERGEKRQKINPISGPSAKFMRNFYKRHPTLSKR